MISYFSQAQKTMMLIASITIIDTMFYYLTENSMTLSAKILRLALCLVLMMFIYKGHGWSKWFTGIFLLVNSLLCTVRVFLVFPNTTEVLCSILYVGLYGIVGLELLSSKSVSVFMRYQKMKR